MSNTNVNSIPVGNDSYAGTIAAPFLTFGKVVATATDGDTVYFNDGTYLSTDGASGTAYFTLGAHSVSWIPVNSLQVTWKANSVTRVIFFAPGANKTVTIGAIIINATGASQSASCIDTSFSAMSNPTLTLSGTELINFTGAGFLGNAGGYNLTVRNISIQSSITNVAGTYGIAVSSNSSGTTDIDGVSLSITGSTAIAINGIFVDSSSAAFTGTASHIKNITGTLSGTGNIIITGVQVRNIDNALIEHVDNLTVQTPPSPATGVGYIARITNTGATLTANNGTIKDSTGNILNAPAESAFSIGPYTGSDAVNHANNGLISNVSATGINNGTTNTPHGAEIHSVTGARITGSHMDGFNPAFLLSGTDSTSEADNNVATNCYGLHCLYFKNATGSKYYNNTVYMTAGHSGTALSARGSDGANLNPDVNAVFNNNIVYLDAASPAFVEIYGNNTAILSNNVYYSTNSLISTSWVYGANNYSTISNWSTAHDFNASYSDPKFVSSSNYNLTALSPAIDAGTTVLTSTTTDYANNPIYGTPDIGAYEYQPPHDLAIATPDTMDVGAGARIYADGKFRDLTATTSVSAHLKITPASGSFTVYDATTTRPAYLDVTAITSWTTSHKTWTESNAEASDMVTAHTVGDLTPNKYYTITISDLVNPSSAYVTGINGTTCTTSGTAACLADANGNLSFSYTGGYSTHTFDMTELDSSNAITAFSFAALTPAVTATINGTAITATVPYGTPITALVATFTTTGSSVAVGATPQVSGTTPNDFTSLVTYTVTAADSTTQDYTVTVTVAIAGGGVPWFYIAVSAGENGKITPTSSSFPHGSAQTFGITPNSGYQIRDVLVDDVSIGIQASYTFNYLNGSHTISATFSPAVAVQTPSQPTVDLSDLASIQREIQRLQALIRGILAQNSANQTSQQYVFTKYLKLGTVDPEVKQLQQYLNARGFTVAKSGPGSPGNETTMFGSLTKQAVIKFQEKYASEILAPAGFKKGTGIVAEYTRKKLNELASFDK